jgi:hypothetical protein
VASNNDAKPVKSRGFMGVLPYLLDVIIPLVSYYSLTAAGLTPFWALVIGGSITTPLTLVNTFRRGKLDKLGLLVLLEIVLGIALDLTVQSPKLTLARASLYILVAAAWLLSTAFTRRPATVDVTKGFAAKKGGRKGIEAFEWLASNSPSFLRLQRMFSGVWGAVFMVYAILRVVIIYTVSISHAVWLTELPGLVAIVICMAVSARCGKRLETMVYARMDEMDATAGQRRDQALTQDLR